MELYSPSVFSLTIKKSMSPGFFPLRGEGTPTLILQALSLYIDQILF